MNGKPMKILIAEDDYFVRREIKRALEPTGHEIVAEAPNGKVAVEKTVALMPDAVLMDIEMPVMDGIEAAERIQAAFPTPILFLTAHASVGMIERASGAGAAAYLTKPPGTEELRRALCIAWARHRDLVELGRLNDTLMERKRELEAAVEEIRTLREFLPICAHCKSVRNDKGYWERVEQYFNRIVGMEFSHGICPDCCRKHYPDYMETREQ